MAWSPVLLCGHTGNGRSSGGTAELIQLDLVNDMVRGRVVQETFWNQTRQHSVENWMEAVGRRREPISDLNTS